MTDFPKWSDIRADLVERSGGEEAVAAAGQRNQEYIDSHLSAEPMAHRPPRLRSTSTS
ncbi:hypothetical protein Pve01_22060 [Planomonospora venezuelensis]|nr:hypothetical protein Pve01_22060 [Planomonospora venezuelensis]